MRLRRERGQSATLPAFTALLQGEIRMRFVSLGLVTVLALACGDGDTSTIDPGFLAGSGPDADEASRGAQGGSRDPGVGQPDGDDPGMTTQPAISCGKEAGNACSMEAGGNAAWNDGKVPGAGASGGEDSQGQSGSGAGTGDGTPGSGGDGSGNGSAGSGNGNGATDNGSAGSGAGGNGSAGNGSAGNGGDGAGGAGGGSGGDGGDRGPLPDLILDGAYLMATIQQDFVDASADQCLFNEGCVTGDGRRRVVRFGTRSANVGTADVVVGEPVAGNPLWEFDACHEHFHFEGYARYDLVDASSGEVLPIGNKNGFCLRDLDNWSNPSCATYDCDYQGISVGCADVYTPDLDCQWVDITDVAPGRYELVVTVNTERSIRELSFENNSARVTIEVEPETVRIVP